MKSENIKYMIKDLVNHIDYDLAKQLDEDTMDEEESELEAIFLYWQNRKD